MNNKNTRIELIAYIKANSPKILGINRMKKEELLEVYSSITKPKKQKINLKKKIKNNKKKRLKSNKKQKLKKNQKQTLNLTLKHYPKTA